MTCALCGAHPCEAKFCKGCLRRLTDDIGDLTYGMTKLHGGPPKFYAEVCTLLNKYHGEHIMQAGNPP